jgi:RNA polymerase sigma factor (sigma-70 family)
LQGLADYFPNISLTELSQIEERLHRSLSSRQQWILSTRKQPALTSVVAVAGEEGEPGEVEIVDSHPNAEMQMIARQEEGKIRKRITSLPADEQLLLQLRFEQDLSLEEIAHVCGLGDAQRVHRKLAGILKRLRKAMQ